MICFFFFLFLFLLNQKIRRATHFSHSVTKKAFSEVALQTRESLKWPYFPLPLSILAGTNLIIFLFLFFCNPRLIPKKIHLPLGLFAFVPLDLNFTNPKSTIFERGWKTQPLPANKKVGQILYPVRGLDW